MDVVFIAPAYPAEMPHFTRGLAEVGARVYGIGDSHVSALPKGVKRCLHDYLRVPRILDEKDVLRRATAWLRGRPIDRIESLWEPTVLTAAKLRQLLGVPGMSADTVYAFRDKQEMKRRIAAAGLRVPYAFEVRTTTEARMAAERVGYPLIAKPIAGAGSADTYRVDGPEDLERVLQRTRHVEVLSIEEFIDGREFTYDTVCIGGRPAYENVAEYLPRPLIARSVESIDPIICTVRDLRQPAIQAGLQLGRGVLKALRMGTGFTHMEWYLKPDGEVVFGEIGCRVGGARLVDQMNYTSDIDLFREWARAVCWQTFQADTTRKYNTAIIFKRAKGNGHIRAIRGLEPFVKQHRNRICSIDLLPVGSRRRDWTQTLVSDGYLIVRDPDWNQAIALARSVASDIEIYAQ